MQVFKRAMLYHFASLNATQKRQGYIMFRIAIYMYLFLKGEPFFEEKVQVSEIVSSLYLRCYFISSIDKF